MKKHSALSFFLFLFSCTTVFFPTDAASKETLKASLAHIPESIDSPTQGPFIDLLRALEPYTEGKIHIEVFPFARSIRNVETGKADFHIPSIKTPNGQPPIPGYHFTKESLGSVSLVLYSNVEKPITKKMVLDALKTKKAFPYILEGPPAVANVLYIPCLPSKELKLSLEKIAKKKIDGLIWSQEPPDIIIKKNNLTMIHQEFGDVYDSTIVVANTPRGEQVDTILSSAIQKMRASGKLAAVYSTVHKPYNPWQPCKQK